MQPRKSEGSLLLKMNRPSLPILLIITLFASVPADGCFILVMKDKNKILVANHEDWFSNNSAVRIIPRADGRFGSVIFTFTDEGWAQGGMNEKGLFFDAARTPRMELEETGKPVATFYLWQRILDKCSTVAEALKLLNQYHVTELSEAHIVLADATGHAVTIGVNNGKVAIKSISEGHLLQTNFNPWHPALSDEPRCWRYDRASMMTATDGSATPENLRKILMNTHQDSLTIYSNIYDLKAGRILTYRNHDFEKEIAIDVNELLSFGDCMIPLANIRSGKPNRSECVTLLKRIRGQVTSSNGEAIPYVSIGIPKKSIGTLSDPDGSFEVDLPLANFTDTLLFSSIGFESKLVPPSELKNAVSITLTQKSVVLKPVTVSAKRNFRVARVGWMGGKDGILPMDTVQGGGAVALLCEAPSAPAFVRKLQVRLMYNSRDTLQLRFHIFSVDTLTGKPDRELLTEDLILKETKRFGWIRFDLESKKIVIPEKKFFIAFEWIEDRASRNKMIEGLRQWEKWKRDEYLNGSEKVKRIIDDTTGQVSYKYYGNMMNWPGFKNLPPFTGLMIETGKTSETRKLKTFERKTSFAEWREVNSTLNAVIEIGY